jgi:hypothetical protein
MPDYAAVSLWRPVVYFSGQMMAIELAEGQWSLRRIRWCRKGAHVKGIDLRSVVIFQKLDGV